MPGSNPAIRALKGIDFLDLNKDEITILGRLTVLTKDGTQECVYTNKQMLKEFGFNHSKANRIIKTLADKGYINLRRSMSAFGNGVRIISLSLRLLISRKESTSNAFGQFAARVAATSASASAPTPAVVDAKVSAFQAVVDAQSLAATKEVADHLSISSACSPVVAPASAPDSTPAQSSTKAHESVFLATSVVQEKVSVENGATAIVCVANNAAGTSISECLAKEHQSVQQVQSAAASTFAVAPVTAPQTAVIAATTTTTAATTTPVVRAKSVTANTAALPPTVVDTCKFDFTSIMRARGLPSLNVGGLETEPRFDFTGLAQQLNSNHVRECHFAYGWPEFCSTWAQPFFLFTVLDEICYHADEMFACPEDCPCYNLSELASFIKTHQQGLLFFILSARYGYEEEQPDGSDEWQRVYAEAGVPICYTGKLLIYRILSSYKLGKSKNPSPLPFIKSVILRQCMEILSNYQECNKLFQNFISEIYKNAAAQRWARSTPLLSAMVKDNPAYYEKRLALYFPVYTNGFNSWYDFTWASADGMRASFPMRLTYPFLLMRKLGGLDHIADYNRGGTARADRITRKVNFDLGHTPAVERSWEQFVALHGDKYPFLIKLAERGYENI